MQRKVELKTDFISIPRFGPKIKILCSPQLNIIRNQLSDGLLHHQIYLTPPLKHRLGTERYKAVRNELAKSRPYEEAEVLDRLQTPETKDTGMRKANQLVS